MIYTLLARCPSGRIPAAERLTLFGLFVLGLGWVWPASAAAQGESPRAPAVQGGSSGPDWSPEAGLEEMVRSELEDRWGVDAEELVLEWGQPRGGTLPDGAHSVRLLGAGKDGRWVASFEFGSPELENQSVLLRAGVLLPRMVARRALERGAVVTEEDMATESRVHWGPPVGPESPCEPGWVVQRSLDAGEELTPPAVQPPLLVVSGSPVTVVWSQGKVNLTLMGRAAGSAARGERVFVRTETGIRLEGLVEGPGLVRISDPRKESGR